MKSRSAGRTAGPPAAGPVRRAEGMQAAEALALLDTVDVGRVVFTRDALPAVRPVNHVVDGGEIVIRVQDDSTLAALLGVHPGTGVVVAYEADSIDPDGHLGWSVTATGYATAVTEPDEIARYARLLRPWVAGTASGAIRIRPDLVTGYRLGPGGP
ncbi:pyridoxamine 5'-phosphate oxidase family protein [Streptomyces racemochromogenes]|uniref:Pyridoxamine 5'-phosphate oxidase family protein n=1 Tax=Streptomyces racemochromogenes TaxID=67353 RepID=A0ABW7PML3_9ACTN